MADTRKEARCAIYTRKSTEHNLDLEFNSLDAQREACEAYIKSQAHEGWRLIPAHYDDGGISGASLERPAMQELVSQIQVGRVDIVVVYKVDRLTRSLTDFAKLVDLFDRHNVSFVSITQAFNTTTSMGRLTLNVLLSFAQFEREVIGERVRDKIAASKRKGLWMGGPVPLGYVAKDKKLIMVPEEAETVRLIFQRYLGLGAIGSLMQELDRLDIKTKKRKLSSGRIVGGGRFGKGALNHFLHNRCYIGEIEHRGEIFSAGHEPILDRSLFDAVQAKLSSNAAERKLSLKSSQAPLTGKIYDDKGNRMGPSHAIKNGVRYRYYVSTAILQRRSHEAGSVSRVSAVEIEGLIADAIRVSNENTPEGSPVQELDRAIVSKGVVEVRLVVPGNAIEAASVIRVPWAQTHGAKVKGIVAEDASADANRRKNGDVCLMAISKARIWLHELSSGRATIADIARREGKGERYIRLLLPLAFVAPTVVEAIAQSGASKSVSVVQLTRLSDCWTAQSI